MKRFIASVILSCAAITCSAADHPAQVDDIREATFRYQFLKNASGQQQSAKVYFLSIYDSEKKKSEDPSDSFMKRFAGNKPHVLKASESKSSMADGVRDKKTGEQGLIFEVGAIYWKSEGEVEVDGGYYEAGLSASGNTYTLKKKDGKWVVESGVMHWISQYKPKSPVPMSGLRSAMAHL